jgi:WD40 repeat protein
VPSAVAIPETRGAQFGLRRKNSTIISKLNAGLGRLTPANNSPLALTSTVRYDGFVSYSHAADGQLAPAIQSALHRLARPWYRRRALHVFRDQTNLSVSPELWSRIEAALGQSSALILLASPGAASSKWVQRETEFWTSRSAGYPMYIVLTDGDVVWDPERDDFNAEASTAIPPALFGIFSGEPLWIDLRWARSSTDLSLKNPKFADAMATLAAALRKIDKDELIGEDVRQHRRTRRAVLATIVTLTLLLIVALGLWRYARRQFVRATENLANSLAVIATAQADSRDTALLTGVAASRVASTWQTRAALLGLLQHYRQVRRFLYPREQLTNVIALAASRYGQIAALTYGGSGASWDAAGKYTELVTNGANSLVAYAGNRLISLHLEGDVVVLHDGKTIRPLAVDAKPLFTADPLRAPLFVSNPSGNTIAIVGAESDGPSRVIVCTGVLQVTCIAGKGPSEPKALALSDDGTQLALAWNNNDAAQMQVLRTSDLSQVKSFTSDQERALAITAEGGEFRVLFGSGREYRLPSGVASEAPPLNVPKPRFSSAILAAANGNTFALSDAIEGIGLPEVDSTVIALDRSLPLNGLISHVQSRSEGVIAISEHRVAATRKCTRSDECAIHIGSQTLSESAGDITAATFSPSGDMFTAGMKNGRVFVWKVQNGSIISSYKVHEPVTAVEMPSDEHLLIVSGRDIELVNPHSSDSGVHVQLPTAPNVVDITAYGHIFLAHENQEIFEYDAKQKKEIPRGINLDALPDGADDDDNLADVLAVSRDGRFLATVANAVGEGVSPKILLRDLTDIARRPILLPTDNTPVEAMVIGNTFLAAATADKIRLWERRTGTAINPPFVAATDVAKLQFGEGDSFLTVYYADQTVETITLALPDLQRAACEIVSRDLSPDEWQVSLPSIPYERPCETLLGRPLGKR